jgi:hypothetical protein
MPTATAAPSAKPSTASKFVIDTAKQTSDQLLTVYRQTAKFTLDAAETWIDTLAKVPGPKLPVAPLQKAFDEWMTVGFDLAEGILSTQRDLATQAAATLAAAGKD